MKNTKSNITKPILIASIAILLVSLSGSAAFAQGRVIIPDPPDPTPRFQQVYLEHQEIKTSIDGQIAKTHIKQVWRNDNRMDLEGIFLFPLPTERASMSDFILWMDGKQLNFETLDADKARNIYEGIVRQMRDPGLLEYVGDGLLRCRIYPIPANGTKEIELEYREIITKDGTLSKYTFPLEIKEIQKPIGSLLLDINIKSNTPMSRVYSPTHDIAVDMQNPRQARATIEQTNYRPSGEFVLFIATPENEFGVDLITYNPNGDDGYFLGLITPRFDYDTSEEQTIPKNFMFILDTSGSMMGEKMQQAKDALKFILRNLNKEDRFGIITFASDVRKFSDQLEPVSKVNEALRFVDTLSAAGGTNINDALAEGLAFRGYGDRPFYIVFLTDGQATVGERNTERILANAAKANERNARIFAFGVGDDVNIALVDRLARENGGASTNVAVTEDIEIPISELYQKIKSPVLTDIEVDIKGVTVYDVYPRKLPDLFKGSQLVITGRYKGSGTATAALKGKIGGASARNFTYNLNFKPNRDNNFIPPLWANRKIGFLLNEIRLYGDNEEMVEQIKTLAKQYGIITPYTSYLVLEDERQWESLVGMPRAGGFSHSRNMEKGHSADMSAPAMERSMSKRLDTQERAESLADAGYGVDDEGKETTKRVKDKTFIHKDNYWVDTDYNPEDKLPEKKLEFMSDEYFDLLDKFPDIGDYLAVGENLKLVWKGTVYIITDDS